MKKMLVGGVSLVLALIIASCGNDLSGQATREVVSTLLVKTVNESGDPLCDVEVYVQGQLKGKTHCYGNSIGTKAVILSGTENLIKVAKEGYLTPETTTIPATEEGEQEITFTLQQQKAGLTVMVEERGKPVDNAEIAWYHESAENSIPFLALHTDAQGQANIEELEDGSYVLKVSKEGYETAFLQQDVALSSHNNKIRLAIELTSLPPLEIRVMTDDQPLDEAEVAIYTKTEYNRPRAEPLHIKFTNQDGKTLFEDAKSEEAYVLVIKKEGFTAQVREIVASSQDHSFLVQMIPE